MNIVVTGDCEKHDFVLATAILLKSYHENDVAIVTDNTRAYQYLNDEISGVRIQTDSGNERADIMIYDWHQGIPSEVEDAKIIFVTSYERRALAHIDELVKQNYVPLSMIVIEEECRTNFKYIKINYPFITSVNSYQASSERRIDWISDGRIQLKVEKDFAEVINTFLIEVCDMPQRDLKKVWRYARKRG